MNWLPIPLSILKWIGIALVVAGFSFYMYEKGYHNAENDLRIKQLEMIEKEVAQAKEQAKEEYSKALQAEKNRLAQLEKANKAKDDAAAIIKVQVAEQCKVVPKGITDKLNELIKGANQ
ncbi:hypothetical protein [Flavobacterium sp.]|jgi:hypothetical protein|uniref:hypothetical protein n=1 Tax=Flavobacterium sp. TaxID=239 RepID=UPI0037C05837